jgi:muconolactone delta-isomerase
VTQRVPGGEAGAIEFLVEFDVEVPDGTSEAEVEERTRVEAVAAAGLAAEGHLLRLWRPTEGDPTAVGLYAADSRAELDALLSALPLADWMQMRVVQLSPHPNDPGRDVR